MLCLVVSGGQQTKLLHNSGQSQARANFFVKLSSLPVIGCSTFIKLNGFFSLAQLKHYAANQGHDLSRLSSIIVVQLGEILQGSLQLLGRPKRIVDGKISSGQHKLGLTE